MNFYSVIEELLSHLHYKVQEIPVRAYIKELDLYMEIEDTSSSKNLLNEKTMMEINCTEINNGELEIRCKQYLSSKGYSIVEKEKGQIND